MTPMRIRSRRIRKDSPAAGFAPVVAQLATIGLVAGLLLAAQAPAAAEPAATVAAKRSAACVDVLVVGIDGNGQGKKDKPGQVVGSIVNKIKAKAAKQGRTTTFKRVKLSTPGAVVTLRTKKGPGAQAVSRAGLKKWKKPVRRGIKATRKVVNRQLGACPEQQVLLVGYAQGAAVAHRVLQDLDAKDALANVAGAVTVSDPSRVRKSSTGRPLGSPAAARNSEGILTAFTKTSGDVPDATGTFRVVSVCHKGDLVCNPSKVAAAKALSLSLSYASKKSRSVMKAAAARAWAQVSLWPVPASQQVVVGVGEAFSTQIAVAGGSPTAPAARFTPVSVPTGLSLGDTGVLTGRIDLRASTRCVSPSPASRRPPRPSPAWCWSTCELLPAARLPVVSPPAASAPTPPPGARVATTTASSATAPRHCGSVPSRWPAPGGRGSRPAAASPAASRPTAPCGAGVSTTSLSSAPRTATSIQPRPGALRRRAGEGHGLLVSTCATGGRVPLVLGPEPARPARCGHHPDGKVPTRVLGDQQWRRSPPVAGAPVAPPAPVRRGAGARTPSVRSATAHHQPRPARPG